MANEFIIKRGFQSKGNSEITGSLSATGNINTDGTIIGSNLSGTNTGDQDLSALAQKTGISGSFVAPSSSFSTRVTFLEEGGAVGFTASGISGSLGANATLIRSLTATGISGSFVAPSASFSTRVASLENNPTVSPGTLSSSAQIASNISGSFVAPSSSFSTRVASLESKSVYSGSFSGSLLGNGSNINSINGSNISSGTIAATRVATLNQNTTGNAATATTLATARTINGISFNGSADITTVDGNTGGTGDILTSITIGTTEYIVTTGTGAGNVETSGTPLDNDYAKFTSGYQIEGRSTSEVKTDLSLNNVENTALSTYTGNGGALDNQYIANGRGFALKTAISGAFVASSASFSTRTTTLESNPVFTATSISGSFTSTSASLSSRITTNKNTTSVNKTLITGITSSLSTAGRMVFVGSNGTLTSENGFAYNATTNQLSVDSLLVNHLTSSFITASRIYTSGSNIFGDSISDTQTLIGTILISGSTQITGSLGVTNNIKAVGTVIGSNLSGTNTGDQDLSALALKTAISGSFVTPSSSFSTRVTLNDAKVTANTTNVTSAGALMDSEVTDLAGVKGVTISTLQVKPSEGAFANGDKTKLDSIESSADVTDTANVTSAGALMDSELADIATVKSLTKAGISGSFGSPSSSFSTRVTFLEEGGAVGFTSAGISGSFGAPSASFSTRVTLNDAKLTANTTNVTNAGALMDSELTSIANVKALNQSVVSGATPAFTTTNFTDASNKRLMTDAQETKLDSVETDADVTDTANVTSAGALMDSELADIATIKSLTKAGISGSFTELSASLADRAKFTSIWDVVSPNGGQYEFKGPGLTGTENKPALHLTRGEQYRFDINASGHPFYIQTTSGGYSSGNVYNDGVTGNGIQSGNLDFNVQFDAPTKLYYVCSYHSGMGNIIYIDDFIPETAATASYVAGGNVDGAVATATLAADATTLATPRAINGVNFDGSAAITVTAAGSTLSDTVTVAKGGTGATSLTATRVLIGNGTSAVTSDSGFSYASNILNTEGLNISSVSAQSSEATSLMINGDGVVGTRELGSNAFNSTAIPTAAMISGSFTATSSSFSSRIAANEIITAKTLISGSSQISLSDYSMGTGLDTTGGGTGLALDLSEFTDMTGAIDTAADELILLDSGAERRKLFSEIFGSNAYNSTTIGTNTNALTVDNATVQLNSGTTFNGSAARTLSAKTAAIANGGAALATADQIHTFVTGQTDTMAAATTGNAATATTLATARNINGVSFNGSANITVTAAAGTLSGNTLKSSVLASSLTSVGILSALDILGDLEVGNDIKFGTTDAAPQHILDAQDDQIISITDGGLTKLIAAGNLDIGAHTFRASTFYADVATGTAPFTVTSTTPVANLQAATATILHTARNIAGVSFNGSANISLNNNAITNGAGYTTNTGTLTGNGATYRIPIYNGTTSFTTDSGFNYQGNMLSTEALNISSVSAMNSEATSLMINGDSTVGIRELGSNAFNSTTIGTNTGALTVSTGLDLNSGTTFNGSAARTISVDVSDFMTNGANNRIVTATGTDAMNGEANLTFDGTSLIVAGQRPVKITSSTVQIQGQANSGWATGYIFLGSGTTNRGGYGATGNADTLTYYYIGDAYNDTTMHIQPNAGNVGIGMSGTTAPSQKLTVAGTIMSTGTSNPKLILQDSTHSDITINGDSGIFSVTNAASHNITMLYSGNVGIGTTEPVGKLEVAGNFRVSGTGTGNDSYPIHFSNTSVAIARDDNDLELHAYNAIVFGASTTTYPTSTERMRITNAGNVGIGTTAPSQKLHVNGAALIGGSLYLNDTNTQIAEGTGNSVNIITDSGNVLIGAQNSGFCHYVTDRPYNYFSKGVVVDTGIIGSYNQDLSLRRVYTNANDSILIRNTSIGFFLDGAEDMRLENDGDLHVEGDVIAASTTISDKRLKDNIIPINGALDKIKSLRGVSYTWNAGHKKGRQDIGLIAQEVEEVLPDIVTEKKLPIMKGTDADTKYKTIDYEKIIAVLVEAVKDQQKQIDNLKKQIKK